MNVIHYIVTLVNMSVLIFSSIYFWNNALYQADLSWSHTLNNKYEFHLFSNECDLKHQRVKCVLPGIRLVNSENSVDIIHIPEWWYNERFIVLYSGGWDMGYLNENVNLLRIYKQFHSWILNYIQKCMSHSVEWNISCSSEKLWKWPKK